MLWFKIILFGNDNECCMPQFRGKIRTKKKKKMKKAFFRNTFCFVWQNVSDANFSQSHHLARTSCHLKQWTISIEFCCCISGIKISFTYACNFLFIYLFVYLTDCCIWNISVRSIWKEIKHSTKHKGKWLWSSLVHSLVGKLSLPTEQASDKN